jgi:flagellum-specific ATP synthase
VLVEADDHNEPVADAVRGISDGHIVMTREIAERGRYPASTCSAPCRGPCRAPATRISAVVTKARQVLATYADMEELIRLGAYRSGASAEVDEAVA